MKKNINTLMVILTSVSLTVSYNIGLSHGKDKAETSIKKQFSSCKKMAVESLKKRYINIYGTPENVLEKTKLNYIFNHK